jgi:hypothetical protein
MAGQPVRFKKKKPHATKSSPCFVEKKGRKSFGKTSPCFKISYSRGTLLRGGSRGKKPRAIFFDSFLFEELSPE